MVARRFHVRRHEAFVELRSEIGGDAAEQQLPRVHAPPNVVQRELADVAGGGTP